MRRLALLPALLLTAAVILTPPSVASAAEVGINAVGAGPQQSVEIADGVGARWVRSFVRWDTIEPARQDQWSGAPVAAIDEIVGKASLRGMKVLLVVFGAPSWANGSSDPLVPPSDAGTYAHFVGKMAARYKGQVAAWEIWNEPDADEFWHGTVSPAAYAPLLRAAHPRIKAADPATMVLASPSTGNDHRFLEGIYAAGAGHAFDGVVVHTDTACNITSPDSYYREPDGRIGQFSFLGWREVREVLVRNGQAHKPIIISEIGWSASQTPCARGAKAGQKAAGVSESSQAAFLRTAWRCMATYPGVLAALWFSARDHGHVDEELNRYGLLRTDDSHRPAFGALAAIGAGEPVGTGCGDFAGPRLEVLSPRPSTIFDRALLLEATGRDEGSGLRSISFYGAGKKLRTFGNLRNGQKVAFEWNRARYLPFGPVKVVVVAADGFGNTTREEIDVQRVDPATLPKQPTKVTLKVTGKGRTRTAKGRVDAPGFAAWRPGGRVLITWEAFRDGRWKPVHKMSRSASRSFTYRQRLRFGGRWRCVGEYQAERPFGQSRSKRVKFKVS